MLVYLTDFSAATDIFKFFSIFIVFIAVIVAAYYFTKWYAKSGFIKRGSNNIEIVETFQMSPGKIVYILKIGQKYVSVVTSKDNVVKLVELSEDDLDFQKAEMIKETSFKEVMGQMLKNKKEDKKH